MDCALFGNINGDLVIAHFGKLSFLKEEIMEIDYNELKNVIEGYKKAKPSITYIE